MKPNKIHIVALNVPYPADYGGAIDIFYKIKALYELGLKIELHCFQYGRDKAEKLEEYCESVHYYTRNMHWKYLLSTSPFIVKTRSNKELLENLLKDDAPILFEGLHSCNFLNHQQLAKRIKLVRTHNIESDYYKALAKSESKLLDKLYLYSEFLKIKKFEKKVAYADAILSISQKDHRYFNKLGNSVYIKAFHPDASINCKEGLGDYALYHGNLSVAENENSALFLIQKVFRKVDFPLVIAGYAPNKKLRKEVAKHSHIRLVESPEESILERMIQKAQMHVLPTMQATGIKLKLLKSLHSGRHCIVNNEMIAETGLEQITQLANSPKEWISKINELEEKAFTKADIQNRKKVLKEFKNSTEAQKIITLIESLA